MRKSNTQKRTERSQMQPNAFKRALLLIAALAVLPVSLYGCTGGTEPTPSPSASAQTGEPSYGGSVTVGIAQDLNSLDPHLASTAGTREVMFNLFEGLMKVGSDGEVIPAVASGLAGVAPTYYVTGNHEWAAHAVQELEPLLEENGVHVLSNTYVMLERGGDKIALLGAEDSNGYADQKTIAELSEEVRQEQGDVYKILLSHRNTRIEEYVDAHIDLTLCGHAHGGLIRLPGTDGLIGPHREFFPSYTAGLYDLPYGQLVASRGLGNQFPAFRLFNRPDVPVVVLE